MTIHRSRGGHRDRACTREDPSRPAVGIDVMHKAAIVAHARMNAARRRIWVLILSLHGEDRGDTFGRQSHDTPSLFPPYVSSGVRCLQSLCRIASLVPSSATPASHIMTVAPAVPTAPPVATKTRMTYSTVDWTLVTFRKCGFANRLAVALVYFDPP